MIKIYSSFGYKRFLRRLIHRQYMREVYVDYVPKGIVVNEHRRGFGIFTSNKRFVKSSCQVRKNNGQFVPKFDDKNIPYIDKDVVFVGNVYPAFGHFLLEHMNRAWAFLDDKYKNMTAVLINNQDVNPVPEYMFCLLELLGIKRKNILIVNQTTQFRNVYVPAQGYNLPVYSCDEFGKTFDEIANNVPDAKKVKKIYVSRTALNVRKTYGEEQVQKIFEKNGFKIIYPEKLPLDKQIMYVKNCDVLAGCAGTALHLALFMKPNGTVIQLKRNKPNKCSAATQYLINQTKHLNSIFINASVEKYRTDHCSNAPQIIGPNEYLLQFFDDYKFKYSKSDVAFDKTAWQEYENAMKIWKQQHGSVRLNKMKHLFVRIASCFVLGRERRGRFRHWLKHKIKAA